MLVRPFLLLLSCAPLVGCGASASGAPSASAPAVVGRSGGVVEISRAAQAFVTVEPANQDRAAPTVRAPARLGFREGAVAEVAAPIEGRVVEIGVKVGDRVKAGDSLAVIQSPAAASSRAELDNALAASRAAQAAVARQSSMLDKGVGTEAEHFQAEIDAAKASAELSRAERAVAYLGPGSGSTVVVRAPIAGVVLQRKTTVGAAADPNGQPLVEIGDPSALWAIADVFDRDLPLVKPGAPATIDVTSLVEPLHGRVASVGSALDDGLRSAQVFVSLVDPPPSLRAGMYARATISADAGTALVVPVTAVLVKEGGRSIVYVEKSERAFAERDVKIGVPLEGRVQVLSGLSPGERVVTQGALLLDEAAEQLL